MTKKIPWAMVTVAIALSACGADLSSYQESVVGGCIKAAIDEARAPECMKVTGSMERAFLKKYPTFKEDYLREKRQAQADERARHERYQEKQAALRREKALQECAEATLLMRACKDFCDGSNRAVAKSCPNFSKDEIAAGIQAEIERRDAAASKAKETQDRAGQALKEAGAD